MSIESGQSYHTNQTHYVRKNFTYSNADETLSLGWVPSGASVIDGGVVVATAFNSGTSDTADLGFRNAGDGTADDTNEFATLVDISSVGMKAADELATAGDLHFPSGAEIVVVYNSTGTAPTTGDGYAWVAYIVPNE